MMNQKGDTSANQTKSKLGESQNSYGGILQPQGFPPLPADWESEWETLASSDGALQLFGVLHHKKNWKTPKVLVVLHGLGEHGGRYLHLPHYLQNEVDAIYCLDHRGHGRSEGLRGHVEDFDLYSDDAALVISRLDEMLKKRFGHSEIHLLGHSMGGLIGLRTCLKHSTLPLLSATISAPLLGIRMKVPPVKKALSGFLAKTWGSLQLTSTLDPSHLSHDSEVGQAYMKDRLVHLKVTPKFFVSLESAMADTLKRDSGFHFPMLLIVPMQDKIVDSDVALEFFRNLKHREKVLKTFADSFHEPLNEVNKEEIIGEIGKWIHAHPFVQKAV
ncbi:MAG: lysophospholipase [Bdellovibrio sp.]|nr:lysophospholipase [Bdellovibrio sp.]